MSQDDSAGLAPVESISPSVEDIEKEIEVIQQDSTLDDLSRQALLDRYQESLQLLGEAETFRTLRQQFDTSLEEGPALARKYQSELEALEAGESQNDVATSLGETPSTREVDSALAREKAGLATLQTRLKEFETQLATIRERAAVIGERQISAGAELAELSDAPPSAAGGTAEKARATRQQALLSKLEAERAMLEREATSGEIRTSVAEAARDLTAKQIEVSRSRINALQEMATALVSATLRSANEAADEIREKVEEPSEALEALLREFTMLSEETSRVTRLFTVAESRSQARRNELEHYRGALEDMRRMSQLSGNENSFGIELVRQLNLLPPSREIDRSIAQTGAALAETRVDQFAFERTLRTSRQEEDLTTAMKDAEPLDLVDEVNALVLEKTQLLNDLSTGYNRLIGALNDQLQAEQEIAAVTQEFRSFAKERTILIRTAAPIGVESVRELPGALHELFGSHRIEELDQHLDSSSWLLWLAPLIGFGCFFGLRRLAGRVLEYTDAQTRRISTDHYRHTITAIGVTLLAVLPFPLVAATIGFVLTQSREASGWVFAIGGGLIGLSVYLFRILFLIFLCRPGGVAERHFRWDQRIVVRLRRLSWWWLGLSFPCFLTWTLVFGEQEVTHLNDVGRFTGILMAIIFGVIFGLLFHPKKGVAAIVHQRAPELYFGRLKIFWFVLVILFATTVVVLLSIGYLFTGLILLERILETVTAFFTVFLAYALVIRWFNIRERRIIAEERLAEQRARREALQSQEVVNDETPDESAVFAVQDEEPPDMAEVETQTRNLVSFLSTVLLIWWLVAIWSGFSPAMKVIDGFSILWGLSVTDLGLIVLVVAGVVATLRNLPGLLEVVILRRLDIDAGTRTAINTLAQYAVIAASVAFLFPAIGMDWSSFGWIAAALSVGLGFGLQEVVANFVCGIILLFERPVRVGDVVTVDGIDGTVTRIQIRATTITNWDRKDFIVPNKQFVTGTLMNWTLSSGLNRVVVNVGVAYGSDTEKVRNLLTGIVEDHPALLEDPAPLVTFEGFGESSLDFVMRGYLPSLEGRLAILHELHTIIYRELGKEGIEIPFPQRDLHIRSQPPANPS